MNIALLIESLAGGGSERVVQRLSLALARRGHRVFVYCLRTALLPLDPMAAGGVTVREAGSCGADPLLAWRLARWLRQDRVAVVHAHSCAALVWVFPGARLLGLPLLHVWHGWPLGTPTRYHRLAERLDQFVDRVGINSEFLRSLLRPSPHARTATYLPNGIDLPRISPPEARARLAALCRAAPTSPILLSVGNLRAEKDACGLLAAFALLRREWPAAQLVWLGSVRDEAYGRTVQQTTRTLQLTDQVHFAGPTPDAWRFMAGADVFCLSSRTESMPNVILEAMSQQVPIVATAVGDIGQLGADARTQPWLLRHDESALLAPPGTPPALAAALAYALRDPLAAQHRAARAYEDYRRRFTLDQMVGRYEQVYEDLRRKTGRRRVAGPDAPRRQPRRRPRVLMLGPAPPQVGGMVTSISLLLKSPLRDRYRLYRFATTTRQVRPQGSLSRKLPRRIIQLGESALRHTAALVRLATTLLADRIDLLHIHTCSHFTFYRNLLDLAVAKLLGRAVILHIRGGQFEHFCRNASYCGQWLIRRGFAAADAVLVLSERWRSGLQPFTGRTPVFVIPSAVELAAPPERRNRGEKPCRFLYLATLSQAKGLLDLIAAAAELRGAGVPFELLIAGPATDEPRAVWEARVAAAGLAENTTFLGPVAGEKKTQLLAAADCLVHPSHSEALPNAVLEAAVAGLPVIATAVGSLPELMLVGQRTEPLRPLVPTHNPHALALEMQRLACDAGLRHRIGRDLRYHVAAHYDLAHVAAQLAEVYKQVLPVQRAGRETAGQSAPQRPPVVRSTPSRDRPATAQLTPGPAATPVPQHAGAP